MNLETIEGCTCLWNFSVEKQNC